MGEDGPDHPGSQRGPSVPVRVVTARAGSDQDQHLTWATWLTLHLPYEEYTKSLGGTQSKAVGSMPRGSWRFRSTSPGLANPCLTPRRQVGKQQRQPAFSHLLQRAGAAGTSVFNFADPIPFSYSIRSGAGRGHRAPALVPSSHVGGTFPS